MDIESTTVTPEEIAQFRAELANYPNPEVIAALDAIEECEGYLEDAIPLLLLEAGREPDRSFSDILEKCRKFICQEEVRESLESGMIAPAIGVWQRFVSEKDTSLKPSRHGHFRDHFFNFLDFA
jgi:hypothetical protein